MKAALLGLVLLAPALADEPHVIVNTDWPHRHPPMVIENLACKRETDPWDCGHVAAGYTHEELLKVARDPSDSNHFNAVLLLEIERLRAKCGESPPNPGEKP